MTSYCNPIWSSISITDEVNYAHSSLCVEMHQLIDTRSVKFLAVFGIRASDFCIFSHSTQRLRSSLFCFVVPFAVSTVNIPTTWRRCDFCAHLIYDTAPNWINWYCHWEASGIFIALGDEFVGLVSGLTVFDEMIDDHRIATLAHQDWLICQRAVGTLLSWPDIRSRVVSHSNGVVVTSRSQCLHPSMWMIVLVISVSLSVKVNV